MYQGFEDYIKKKKTKNTNKDKSQQPGETLVT